MAQTSDVLTLTAEIVAAYVGSNNVKPAEVVEIIRSVRSTLTEAEPEPAPQTEANASTASKAEIRKSISDNGLVSFLDGKTYKTLKRHLTRSGLTMAQYRERFGLPADYPSTSPAYSRMRSEHAKRIGLGAKGRNAKPVGLAKKSETVSQRPARAPRTAKA